MSISTYIFKLITYISPRWNTKINYRLRFGKRLNLEEPQTFNEKVMWFKLNTYYQNPLVEQCVDKYAVRKYVEKQGCGEILNDLLGIWDNPDDIDFDKLPDKFVLKCNYFYNMYIICIDKSKLDIPAARKEMRQWLHNNDHLIRSEMQYGATPRKIIAEQFIETQNGLAPIDYKVYCFDGKPKYVMVCIGRRHNIKPKFYYFDIAGNLRREFTQEGIDAPKDFRFELPDEWNEMLGYAKKLSAPFPFVRADFYIEKGKVIFGELTFTPAAGLDKKLEYTEKTLGDLIHLPKNHRR